MKSVISEWVKNKRQTKVDPEICKKESWKINFMYD